jgi:hypothetical protein
MATWYIDLVNGADANAGTSWGAAFKTVNGATAAKGVAAGDTVRLSKTVDPVSLGTTAAWTNGSNVVTLTTAQTLDICGSVGNSSSSTCGWTGVLGTPSNSTTYVKYKDASYTYGLGIPYTSGQGGSGQTLCTMGWPSSNNYLGSYSYISCWFYSDHAIAANMLRFRVYGDSSGNYLYTIPIAIPANTWVPITSSAFGPFTTTTTATTFQLLNNNVAWASTGVLYVSNVFAHNGFSLQSLISKASVGTPANPAIVNETFWNIRSIQGTSVYLGNVVDSATSTATNYQGATETVTTYKRECFQTVMPATTSTVVSQCQKGGTAGSPVIYSGGWDTTSNTQTGETWLDGTAGWGNGLDSNALSYIQFDRIGLVRYYRSFIWGTSAIITGFTNMSIVSSSNYSIMQFSSAPVLTNCYFVQGARGSSTFTSTTLGIITFVNCSTLACNQIALTSAMVKYIGGQISTTAGVSGSISAGYYSFISQNTKYWDTVILASGIGSLYSNFPGVISANHNNVTGAMQTLALYSAPGSGTYTIIKDTTIYPPGATTSIRVTPSSSTVKADTGGPGYGKFCETRSGATTTVPVKIYKSVAGDGAAYNGNQPRLIIRRNDLAGYTADTVLTTCSSANGIWESISGTTATVPQNCILEFAVDCDGTAGWINVVFGKAS